MLTNMLRFFYSNDSSSVTVENSYVSHKPAMESRKECDCAIKVCVLKHLRWRAKLKLHIKR